MTDLAEEIMDKTRDDMLARLTAFQMATILAGYYWACDLYANDNGDGHGKLPKPVASFHNAAKIALNIPSDQRPFPGA